MDSFVCHTMPALRQVLIAVSLFIKCVVEISVRIVVDSVVRGGR